MEGKISNRDVKGRCSHRIFCNNYERKECVLGCKEWFEELNSPANIVLGERMEEVKEFKYLMLLTADGRQCRDARYQLFPKKYLC